MAIGELNCLCNFVNNMLHVEKGRGNTRGLEHVRKLLKFNSMLKKKEIKNLYLKLMAFQRQTSSKDLMVVIQLHIKGKG